MPVTTVGPKTALIVVDLQKGLVDSPFIPPLAEVTKRTQTLLEVFRRLHLALVLINVAGGAPGRIEQPRKRIYPKRWTDLLPETRPAAQRHRGNQASMGRLCQYRS
ncbi:MAG TPA: hypothetical protein VI320_00960 [Terracidiphilus sp.]